MGQRAGLIVRFMDGSKLRVHYPKASGDPAAVAANIRKALEADRLMIEVDGSLLFIPMSSVKYIEVSPAPDVLPATVIRNARLLG